MKIQKNEIIQIQPELLQREQLLIDGAPSDPKE